MPTRGLIGVAWLAADGLTRFGAALLSYQGLAEAADDCYFFLASGLLNTLEILSFGNARAVPGLPALAIGLPLGANYVFELNTHAVVPVTATQSINQPSTGKIPNLK